jgi:hypothetical protein
MDSKEDNKYCPICYEEIINQKKIKITLCQHYFCGTCFEGLLNHHRNKCPICNKEFIEYQLEDETGIQNMNLTQEEFDRISENKKNLESYLNGIFNFI